jgi:hypothetical protein
VIQIDEARIMDHLGEILRGTVKEALNSMLDAGSDQLCGAGTYGLWVRTGNRVQGNTIVHLGARGLDGISSDTNGRTLATNTFVGNRYVVAGADAAHWLFSYLDPPRPAWRDVPLVADVGAERIVEQRRPMDLACPPEGASVVQPR